MERIVLITGEYAVTQILTLYNGTVKGTRQVVLTVDTTGANQGIGFETAKNLISSSSIYHILY